MGIQNKEGNDAWLEQIKIVSFENLSLQSKKQLINEILVSKDGMPVQAFNSQLSMTKKYEQFIEYDYDKRKKLEYLAWYSIPEKTEVWFPKIAKLISEKFKIKYTENNKLLGADARYIVYYAISSILTNNELETFIKLFNPNSNLDDLLKACKKTKAFSPHDDWTLGYTVKPRE